LSATGIIHEGIEDIIENDEDIVNTIIRGEVTVIDRNDNAKKQMKQKIKIDKEAKVALK